MGARPVNLPNVTSDSVPASFSTTDAASRRVFTQRLEAAADVGVELGVFAPWLSFVAGATGTLSPRPFDKVRVVQLASSNLEGLPGPATSETTGGPETSRGTSQPPDMSHSLMAELAARAKVPVLDLPIDAQSVHSFVDDQVDGGLSLIIPALEPTEELVRLALTVTSALTGSEPVWTVGFDAAVPDVVWCQRLVAVRDAVWSLRDTKDQPAQLIDTACNSDTFANPNDGPDSVDRHTAGRVFSTLVGLMHQSTLRATPILLDGVVVSAAALAAQQLNDHVRHWCFPIQQGPAAQRIALDALGLDPALNLGVRVANADPALPVEGVSALLAWPLLQNALATFPHWLVSGQAERGQ